MADGDGRPPPPTYHEIVSGTPAVETVSLPGGLPSSSRSSTIDVRGSSHKPAIPDSPHDSDDEETALLKSELRRLREQNAERKKLDLRRAIEAERELQTTSGSRQSLPGTPGRTVSPPPTSPPPTYQTYVAQSMPGGAPVTIHPMVAQFPTSIPTSGTATPTYSSTSVAGPHPQASATPHCGTSYMAPPPAVASSSTFAAGQTLQHTNSYAKENKSGSTTACCVATFFVVAFMAVVVVTVYALT